MEIRRPQETWTPEQRQARRNLGNAQKAFWGNLTPHRRKKQIKRTTAGNYRPEVQKLIGEKSKASWAQRKAELAELRAKVASLGNGVGAKKDEGGRPREKEELFRKAAELYPLLGSWSKVAKRLTPSEYKKHPRRAVDSLRLGSKYYLQD